MRLSTATAVCSSVVPRGGNAPRRIVLWFRNDLRLHDNAIVHESVRRIENGEASDVLPVYCVDPRWFRQSSFRNGHLKTGNFRTQFLLESVQNLKDNLQSIGSDLLVYMGPPEEVLPKLACGGRVFAQREVTSEEIRAELAVMRSLKATSSKLELFWGSTLYHLDDVPFSRPRLSDMPTVFTPFKQKCENMAQVRTCYPTPTKGSLPIPNADIESFMSEFHCLPKKVEELNPIVPEGHPPAKSPPVDTRAALAFKGGEDEALKRLKYYLWGSNLIEKYFEVRNGMIGGDYSTKLAPALAHGCISPRTIYWEIKRYEKEMVANKSTYWVIFELIWRDFYKFYALKEGDGIFKIQGPIGKTKSWGNDLNLLNRWKAGQTGWPLVDANMRELAATGFMSNRGRQNVASFLALDLGLDWRLGADWFESLLLDYDVASNWGNWVAAAGLAGGRINKFNITKQSKDYDPDGDYIRLWCPELANVPSTRIHEPWLMGIKEQELYGVQIGVDYPQAIPSSARYDSSRQNKPASRFGGSRKGRGGKKNRGAQAHAYFEEY